MIRALLIALLMLPGLALAQTLPALHDVTGVEQSDMLNVRAGPSTDFEVIGKLKPDATGIEVVDTNDERDWALIIFGERAGWVALRFLARQPGQPVEGLPNSLGCFGTEPFWGFRLGPGMTAEFTRDGTSIPFQSVLTVPSANRIDRHALFADGGEVVITAVTGRTRCSDGMSDRIYGLGIDLLVTDQAQVSMYSGCCSVAR